ncbi:hypothetical protein CYLTODRAFT_404501 [Cylindrobasidium torrendii FP15055 ss-10]|uniref:Ubiquinone biosynthesis protein n=1 Tax=Cylindrobasidium torrendii FP15055 ss-10 TaxID=1314674 RepID=A0A0D7AWT4_9AGAR|nr:hypothetical protein CYLTODRAFT_404501 [Cylindrobasidium torrendii FP15055 ss-10]
MSRIQLLKQATRLVGTHGFTREALAESARALPGQSEPLSDLAVSALFGYGDDARRVLVNAWLDEGLSNMAAQPSTSVRDALHTRLQQNEPVLGHLPEAFALLASSSKLVPLDPIPAAQHTFRVVDTACRIANDQSVQLAWWKERATLAAVYGAAELHQLTSPTTAPAFLDKLLDEASSLHKVADEVGLFSSYVFKSWVGIARSKGFIS